MRQMLMGSTDGEVTSFSTSVMADIRIIQFADLLLQVLLLAHPLGKAFLPHKLGQSVFHLFGTVMTHTFLHKNLFPSVGANLESLHEFLTRRPWYQPICSTTQNEDLFTDERVYSSVEIRM